MLKAPCCTVSLPGSPPGPHPEDRRPHSLQALAASFTPEGRGPPGHSPPSPGHSGESRGRHQGPSPEPSASADALRTGPLPAPGDQEAPGVQLQGAAASHRATLPGSSQPPGRRHSLSEPQSNRGRSSPPARLPAGSVGSLETGVSDSRRYWTLRPRFSPVPKGFHQGCFRIPGE